MNDNGSCGMGELRNLVAGLLTGGPKRSTSAVLSIETLVAVNATKRKLGRNTSDHVNADIIISVASCTKPKDPRFQCHQANQIVGYPTSELPHTSSPTIPAPPATIEQWRSKVSDSRRQQQPKAKSSLATGGNQIRRVAHARVARDRGVVSRFFRLS